LKAAKEEVEKASDSFNKRIVCISGLATMCSGPESCRNVQRHGMRHTFSFLIVIGSAHFYELVHNIGGIEFVLHWLKVGIER
jgi:hypothetical protein